MSDNDWFFETFHDNADEPLGLDRTPELVALWLFIFAGVVATMALTINLGAFL
jgi:hypothetical protein